MERSAPTDPSRLEEAVLRAVAYGDVFDAPVTPAEVHRYLPGLRATEQEVRLAARRLVPARLAEVGEVLCLAGREELAEVRRRRQRVARELWPRARRAAFAISSLPMVRMVAVTGALAMDNVEEGADVDLLVLARAGRVWLCRWLVIQMVRLFRLRGVTVCPNWVLSEDRLVLDRRELYAARELAQMVPLAGMDLYLEMRRANAWADGYLPNAAGPPPQGAWCLPTRSSMVRRVSESVLGSTIGDPLERWERRRKVREIGRLGAGNPEVVLDPHQCKGHVDGHGQAIARAYSARLQSLSLVP